jgi:uncharacterized protein (TIGR00255 family)
MFIQSMTGFGQAEAKSSNFTVSVEIKSVNNRFKDIRFKMPSSLNQLELILKQQLNDTFSRGTFDVFVNVKRSEDKNRFDDLDENKVSKYLEKMVPIFKKQNINPSVSVTDFLRAEFYKEQDTNSDAEASELATAAFKLALNDLKKSRSSEGEKLFHALNKHLENYRSYFVVIEKNANHFKEMVEEKLKKRVEDYKNIVAVDQGRLLQEVIFYLEKIDIHEEITRVHAHLEKFQTLLKSDNEVGRQIDFFIQELNRETNTMGSKSTMKEISDAVVQMKVQLEKMREQGLNIE